MHTKIPLTLLLITREQKWKVMLESTYATKTIHLVSRITKLVLKEYQIS